MRVQAVIPGIIAAACVPTLFSAFMHSWGCRPTPGSVALVLLWLLPLLGAVRGLVEETPAPPLVYGSWVLALGCIVVRLQPELLASIVEPACH